MNRVDFSSSGGEGDDSTKVVTRGSVMQEKILFLN
jgi:hypothetical protein